MQEFDPREYDDEYPSIYSDSSSDEEDDFSSKFHGEMKEYLQNTGENE